MRGDLRTKCLTRASTIYLNSVIEGTNKGQLIISRYTNTQNITWLKFSTDTKIEFSDISPWLECLRDLKLRSRRWRMNIPTCSLDYGISTNGWQSKVSDKCFRVCRHQWGNRNLRRLLSSAFHPWFLHFVTKD